jgi:peptidoglycan L-alanyl-D-glutamate endopeptidase CwlK
MTDDQKKDLLGRIDTLAMYQPFLEKLNALVLACQARGAIYVATSGLRTFDQQNALYAKGRTAPGGVVTNARGGYSPHNFAVAVDFCRHKGATYEGKLDPDYRDSANTILGEEAAKLGLEWGGAWTSIKDTPHVQLPLKAKGLTWAMLRDWYAKGGQAEVVKQLDAHGPW